MNAGRRPTSRFAVGLATTLLLSGAITAAGSASATPTTTTRIVVAPTQALTSLLRSQEARSRPTDSSPPVGLVLATRPITGEQTVLPVLAQTTSANGLRWLRVRLPGRPNAHTGWIRRSATIATSTTWHVVIDITTRRVIAYNRARPVRTFDAIVGKPSTPTPLGEFFVEESIQLRPHDIGAPYALALSARSDVLQQFDGGPGQIALHGLANIGGTLGTRVSHGCIRLNSTAMRWLTAHIEPGTPVTITSD